MCAARTAVSTCPLVGEVSLCVELNPSFFWDNSKRECGQHGWYWHARVRRLEKGCSERLGIERGRRKCDGPCRPARRAGERFWAKLRTKDIRSKM